MSKIKKGADEPTAVPLTRNADVLAEVVAARSAGTLPAGQVVVGFAAETGDEHGSVLEHGRAKLARKGCDLLVVNDVQAGRGFEVDENSAVILAADGADPIEVPLGPKTALAAIVCDQISRLLPSVNAR